MPTVVQQCAAIDRQRFEAYQAWEYEKLLLDELTDQSERLAAPMENEFEYVLTNRGLAVELKVQTETGWDVRYELVRDVLQKGLAKAEQQAAIHPEWQFELERRRIELEEWEQIEAMAIQRPTHTMVTVSPRPDAVDQGVPIDGYGQPRAMVRRVMASKRGVRIKSVSLHQNNYQALQASVAAIGHHLPDGLSSEERLGRRYLVTEDPPIGYDWTDVMRRAYDLSLAEQLGGQWYAGRPPMDVKDALAFIQAQPDLIDQHMRAVGEVMRSVQDRTTRDKQLKFHRYNFAAALDDRLHGRFVEDVADAGDVARAEGKEFEPDCPELNAEAQLETQGFAGEILCTCPFCGKKVKVDPCAELIKCPKCLIKVFKGEVVSEGINHHSQDQQRLGQQAVRASVQSPPERPAPRVGDVQRLPDGQKIQLHQKLVIGGAEQYWADVDTGHRVKTD